MYCCHHPSPISDHSETTVMCNMTILTENYSYMESSILIMLLQLKIAEITKTGGVWCPLKDGIIQQCSCRKRIKTVKNLPAKFWTTSFQNMNMLCITPSSCFTALSFKHICFISPCQFTLLLNLHPLIWLVAHLDADWVVKVVRVNLVIHYSDDMEYIPSVTGIHSWLQFF